jgi:hypothetical protein
MRYIYHSMLCIFSIVFTVGSCVSECSQVPVTRETRKFTLIL